MGRPKLTKEHKRVPVTTTLSRDSKQFLFEKRKGFYSFGQFIDVVVKFLKENIDLFEEYISNYSK